MKTRLIPCTRCERHVRADETLCPFCAEPVAVEAAQAATLRALPRGRLSSLALMTFRAAAFGAALTACGGSADDDDDGGEGGQGGVPSQAGSGGSTDNPAGSTSVGGQGGAPTFGGSPNVGGLPNGGDGNGIPIYRATPRG